MTTTMAVSTMTTSPNAMVSAFSPYTDSPSSPAQHNTVPRRSPAAHNGNAVDRSKHLSAPAATTGPTVVINVPHASPPVGIDIIDPSPIAPSSNGTEFTDMDEVEAEKSPEPPRPAIKSTKTPRSPPSTTVPSLKIRTTASIAQNFKPKSTYDEYENEPLSVIHAPPGFRDFLGAGSTSTRQDASHAASSTAMPDRETKDIDNSDDSNAEPDKSEESPSQQSDATVTSPIQPDSFLRTSKLPNSPLSPPPLETSTLPKGDWKERPTPQAQTRQEAEDSTKSQRSGGLEDIPENHDLDSYHDNQEPESAASGQTIGHRDIENDVEALKAALSECWTLCNTLASLSSIHRNRIFNFSGKGEMQEQAWRSCWSLCKKLYESREDNSAEETRHTLDLCRDFCQALFEVRVRDNEAADSVLRVSFELNNHLYNTHDRNLPEAFRERTLDFYITLCHRLMKQKTRLAAETDSLLRACWSLAEMLFSLRQNKREGKSADEELLGSAVQACWELCDLFREGWTQIRPERRTPRPSQTSFSQVFNQVKRSAMPQAIVEGLGVPETPTTIFEDTVDTVTGSPEEPLGPNILVFGQGDSGASSSRSNSPAGTQPFRQRHMSPSKLSIAATSIGSRSNVSTPQPQKPLPQPISSSAAAKWSSTSSTLSAVSQSSSHTASSTSTIRTSTSNGTGTINIASHNTKPLTRPPTTAIPTSTNTSPSPPLSSFDKPSSSSPPIASSSSQTSDPTLLPLKLLFLRAAQIHTGYPSLSTSSSTPTSLPTYVKALPRTAFGSQAWQISLFENYRDLVVGDSTFQHLHIELRPNGGTEPPSAASTAGAKKPPAGTTSVSSSPPAQFQPQPSHLASSPPSSNQQHATSASASAADIARAVNAMVESGHFTWLRDLYKIVFGFGVEEAGISSGILGKGGLEGAATAVAAAKTINGKGGIVVYA